MHWKVKAAIQNAICLLPQGMSYATYYGIQRIFGGLKKSDPISRLVAGVQTWKRIAQQGGIPADKVFFEVGTGTTPDVPLAYWLMGAQRTITVDVNPYLKGQLVREGLDYIDAHQEEVTNLFDGLLQRNRLDELLRFHRSHRFSLGRFLDLCAIDYTGSGDAAKTGLADASVDFHTSYTVFEHIPPEVLMRILDEGNRIVRTDGLFVHMIDYSDHFSHSDVTISAVNFLQYSDAEWSRYAGNRFMYMNRLRHDDVLALFESAGHRILETTAVADPRSREILEAGRLRLNERFAAKSPRLLSISGSWVVSQRIRTS